MPYLQPCPKVRLQLRMVEGPQEIGRHGLNGQGSKFSRQGNLVIKIRKGKIELSCESAFGVLCGEPAACRPGLDWWKFTDIKFKISNIDADNGVVDNIER
ncbi:hypothetical protein U1Q18_051038 [Sarracenia purpurea var. burkii]